MFPARMRAAPSTAWAGSRGSMPSDLAVAGMICMSPMAPAPLVAAGLKPDSARATAASRLGSTPWRAPACWNSWLYGVLGDNEDRRDVPDTPDTPFVSDVSPMDAADCDSARRIAIGSYDGRLAPAASVPTIRRMAVGVRVMSWIFTTSPVCGATTILLLPA